jgi:death-on-curing protein
MGDPLPPFDTRYAGILESIIESVKLKSKLLSLDIFQIATSYYVQLAKSQAFFNGNKRMSIVLTDIFLNLNGYELSSDWWDLADLTLLVAEDSTNDIHDIVKSLTPFFKKMIKVKA